MFHLFNSCYLTPDILFNPQYIHVLVGESSELYGAGESFYHLNKQVGYCIGKFKTADDFVKSPSFHLAINNTDKVMIYADHKELVKLYSMFIRTQIKNLNNKYYRELMRLASTKVLIKTKFVKEQTVIDKLHLFSEEFRTRNELPQKERKFNLEDSWIIQNCGTEWNVIKRNKNYIKDLVDSYVFQHMNVARMNHISKHGYTGWVTEQRFYKLGDIQNMREFYEYIRKDVYILADDMIKEYYTTGDAEALLNNKSFMLLFSSISSEERYNTLLIKWGMDLHETVVRHLEILG